MNPRAEPAANICQAAQRRFLDCEKRPLLIGDWRRALFIHYEVPVKCLQPHIPFELDRWQGKAFVSLVAFSMERLRPAFGGAIGRWLLWPFSNNEFFNVRTYVRHRGIPGIFFISEWLNNRCSVLAGPITYGLPYQFAQIQYEHRPARGELAGRVGDSFAYTADIATDPSFEVSVAGSLDEFLMERYTAFTRHGRRLRYFHIWHQPWQQLAVDAHISDDRLLRRSFPWFADAAFVGANYSPGVRDVWMAAPHRINALPFHNLD
jgi:uncharacterized protein